MRVNSLLGLAIFNIPTHVNNILKNIALQGRIVPTFFYYLSLSTIGLVAITTANLVDGMFVGQYVGANALAVITLLVPYFTLLFAFSLMLAIGGSVSAGIHIGAEQPRKASLVFSQSLICVAVTTIALALWSAAFEPTLFQMLSIPSDIAPLAQAYLGVIRWVLIIQLFTMVLYYFVRADGFPKLATLALVAGALCNIVLDAWFVVVMEKGLRGAAYATAISQTLQLLILAQYFFKKHRSLQMIFGIKTREWRYLLRSAYNGLSEFVNEMSVGLVFLLLNALLIARLGVNGVAAFSVANYFIFLSVMLSYGIADSLHLLVSQNFGAKHYQRVKTFLQTAVICAVVLGLSIVLSLFAWKQDIILWFLDAPDTEVAALCNQLLLIIWPIFLINGTNIILSCYLTAIQQARASAYIALSRGLLLPVGLLLLFYFFLENLFGAQQSKNSWWFMFALPLAEWLSFAIAISLFLKYQPLALFKPKLRPA